MAFTNKITFPSNSLGVFDEESDILARPPCRVFIIAVLSIFESRRRSPEVYLLFVRSTVTGLVGGQSHGQTFLLYRRR